MDGDPHHYHPRNHQLATGLVFGVMLSGGVLAFWAVIAGQGNVVKAFRESFDRAVVEFRTEGQVQKAALKHQERLLRLIAAKAGATPAEIKAAAHPAEPPREAEQ